MKLPKLTQMKKKEKRKSEQSLIFKEIKLVAKNGPTKKSPCPGGH